MSKHVFTAIGLGYGGLAKSPKKGKENMSSMDSDTESMLSEKVSSTASESRKNSKPIMEKRRRARINASLAELKSLLLEVMKKEGARQNKMEKADILEITVRHLRTLQKQQFSALATSDPSLINKYRLGYNECASEVSSFLGSMEGSDAEVRSKLLNHLANCMVNPEPSSQTSRVPSSQCLDNLRSSPPQTTVLCKSEDIQNHPHQTPLPDNNVVQHVIPNGMRTNIIDNRVLTIQAPESIVANTLSATIPTTTATLPVQGLINTQSLQIPQFQQQQQQQQHVQQLQQQIVQQPQQVQIQAIQPQSTVQQQPSMQVQKLVSGVQLIPTKMSTGEMAFIIPANLLSNGNMNNFVIPMLQSQALTTQVSTAVAPVTVACTQALNTVQTQAIKPVPAVPSIPTRPKEPVPVYGQPNTNINDQPVIYVQGEALRSRTDERSEDHFNISVSPNKQEDMWRPW
ncbi:protein hairy-like [Ylistrum balloti]|uniref:protein hairy-like n=1 Tax=Ylistrum balloti TaxID=509963 RepID=UPI002905CC2A|nr:protein hairy-like [Ylistrum balloti]